VLLLLVALTQPSALTPGGVDVPVALAMTYLALVPSALAQVLILVSTRRIAARRTSAWLLLTPLTSAVLAMTLLGETPSSAELIGGALVVVGIMGASGAGEEILRAWSRGRAASAG
jgi:DME family drug/metabolite transporter